MNVLAASILFFVIGCVHSILGERYIISRLLRRDLPHLFGSDWFTKRTLRFGWHLTTIAWWGFAALLLPLGGSLQDPNILKVVSFVAFASAALIFMSSHGRHFAWVIFAIIGALCLT